MKSLGLDQYQRTARLLPALLTIAPVTALSFLWAPKAAALLGSLASATVSAGLVTLLMQYGRARGRAVQARTIKETGGLASMVALRHRDDHIPEPLRLRYHAALRKQGFTMPTAAEEAADPVAADAHYRSATDWLPDQLRDKQKFSLLHAENRSYGFCRNLLGLKPVGLALVLMSLVGDGVLLYLLHDSDPARTVAGGMLAAVLVAAALAWVFMVNMTLVNDAAWAYGRRQLAATEHLPAKRAPPRPRAET